MSEVILYDYWRSSASYRLRIVRCGIYEEVGRYLLSIVRHLKHKTSHLPKFTVIIMILHAMIGMCYASGAGRCT